MGYSEGVVGGNDPYSIGDSPADTVVGWDRNLGVENSAV